MLSSTTFMVPSLIFKFVSHFEFIFVYGISECSNFIDLYAAVQLSHDDADKDGHDGTRAQPGRCHCAHGGAVAVVVAWADRKSTRLNSSHQI